MKKRKIHTAFPLLILSLSLGASGLSLAKEPADTFRYTPFFKGSSWTYETSDGAADRFEVIGVRDIQGVKSLFCKSSLSGNLHMVFTKDRLYSFKTLSEKDSKIGYINGMALLASPIEKGKIWRSQLPGQKPATVEYLGTEDTETPAGTFKETIKVGIKYDEGPLYQVIFWLAKDVGIVKTLENQFLKRLASYRLAEEDFSFINDIGSDQLESKLVLLEDLGDRPKAQREKGSGISGFLKGFFGSVPRSTTVFTVILLAIFLTFAVLSLKIAGLLHRDSNLSAADSKANLARTYISTGNYKKVIELLDRHLSEVTPYPDLLNYLGTAYMGSNEHSKASEAFKKALEINPDYVEAKINLAKSLFGESKYPEATTIVGELLLKNPNYSDLHNLKGEIHMKAGEKELAIKHFERAVSINPAYVRAQENLIKLKS